jgi:hypothetical protein
MGYSARYLLIISGAMVVPSAHFNYAFEFLVYFLLSSVTHDLFSHSSLPSDYSFLYPYFSAFIVATAYNPAVLTFQSLVTQKIVIV